jgi:hypothetical protein
MKSTVGNGPLLNVSMWHIPTSIWCLHCSLLISTWCGLNTTYFSMLKSMYLMYAVWILTLAHYSLFSQMWQCKCAVTIANFTRYMNNSISIIFHLSFHCRGEGNGCSHWGGGCWNPRMSWTPANKYA